jgi:pyridoxal phosphate enzyme (YggS family)
MSIADNIMRLQARVASRALAIGRNPNEIEIVAISKTQPPQAIISAVQAGISHIGENKVQEAEAKFRRIEEIAVDLKFTRHFVGHLQTNKAKKAVMLFDLIQSVDSAHLAQELSVIGTKEGRTVNVLLQVNTSGETSKYGIGPENTLALAEDVSKLPSIHIDGLMTIGAFTDNTQVIGKCFRALRKLSEKIATGNFPNTQMRYLSMGMTADFEIAVEEGANLLRIGTAIFGER